MDLDRVGYIDIYPETVYYWNSEREALVEISQLGENDFLVRSSKAYYLLKQDEEGRENWDRNLSKLNDYLANTFSHFNLSVDYSNQVVEEALTEKVESRELAKESKQLLVQKEKLEKEIEQLESRLGLAPNDTLSKQSERQIEQKKEQYREVDSRLSEIVEDLEFNKAIIDEWSRNGVLMSYLFSFSTDAELANKNELEAIIESHLEEAFSHHQRSVKQTLTGPNFKLVVEDLSHPYQFLRNQHSLLLNPENIENILDETSVRENELRDRLFGSFENYLTNDLRIGGVTKEEAKPTPARSVQNIVRELETTKQPAASTTDLPQEGYPVGRLKGTKQSVGFKLVDKGPHFSIAGKSGTGKTHLRRVLLENAVAEGHSVLTISPTKRDSIGVNLANSDHEDGKGLAFNQYWFGDDRLLDKPDDLTELFSGLNAVTLYGYSDRQEFINELFEELDGYDLDDEALFVFLDEAHRFNEGAAAEAIQTIAQEGRSFGIRLVLISQDPKAFQYNYKEVRNNTSFILFNRNYEPDIQNMVRNPEELTNLEQGECLFADFLDLPEITVEVRDTLTRVWPGTPPEKDIEKVQSYFKSSSIEFPTRSITQGEEDTAEEQSVEPNLLEEEQRVVEAVKSYIRENDKRPSKNKTIEASPFGASKTSRILEQLQEKQALTTSTETRYGNEATVYQPSF